MRCLCFPFEKEGSGGFYLIVHLAIPPLFQKEKQNFHPGFIRRIKLTLTE